MYLEETGIGFSNKRKNKRKRSGKDVKDDDFFNCSYGWRGNRRRGGGPTVAKRVLVRFSFTLAFIICFHVLHVCTVARMNEKSNFLFLLQAVGKQHTHAQRREMYNHNTIHA